MSKKFPSNQDWISKVNNYYQNLLGYSIKNTKLIELIQNKWNYFCSDSNLNQNSSGIYFPRNQTAIVPKDNKLSLFHEYFGHGLFCEQSLIGRNLIDLEKKLMDEERQKFENKKFTLEDLKKFRHQNDTFRQLQEFKNKNLELYEGFAIFSEFILSREFNLMSFFEDKYDSLSVSDKEKIESIVYFDKKYGDLATFYNFGLAKRTTTERAKKLLIEIYKDKIKDIKLALLYGSKKEFSDIDLFIVSENLIQVNSSWLDIRIESLKDFEEKVNFLDASIIGPLLDSEYVMGNKDYLQQKRKELIEKPITRATIEYNLKRGEEQKRLALTYPEKSKERKLGFSYVDSYLRNTLFLKRESLKSKYFPRENFIKKMEE